MFVFVLQRLRPRATPWVDARLSKTWKLWQSIDLALDPDAAAAQLFVSWIGSTPTMTFELAVNMKTAKALGLKTLPRTNLRHSDL